jgi:outer membrane protein assembly factor BamE (lipoprotein component of BamABCDE complex)
VIHKTILPLSIMFILLCSGCFVFGTSKDYHPFDPIALESIQPGKTTATEVTALFGSPTGTVELSNGNAYIYHRSVAKATMMWLVLVSFANYDTQVDQIVFFFDNNDFLTHYGVNLNADKAEYGLPF